MKTHTFIYAICDTDISKVKYIGKSNDPVKRFELHIGGREKSPISRWLRSHITEGKSFSVVVLEKVEVSKWQEREKFWIAEYIRLGHNLLNLTIGGNEKRYIDPTLDREMKIEQGKRISKRWSDRKKKMTVKVNKTRKTKRYKDVDRERTSLLWKSEEYRKKVVDGIRKSWKNPETRKKHIAVSKRPRPKLSQTMKDPEKRKVRSEIAKRMWANPDFREKMANSRRKNK